MNCEKFVNKVIIKHYRKENRLNNIHNAENYIIFLMIERFVSSKNSTRT